jgi:hypothetical protein
VDIVRFYAVIFSGFITWYLPKELDSQKTAIIAEMKVQIGEQLGKIPASELQKLILPAKELTQISPADLGLRFQRANFIVDTAIGRTWPPTPQTLDPVKDFVREALKNTALPPPTQELGVSALVHVDGYRVFSAAVQERKFRLIFAGVNFDGGVLKPGEWPTKQATTGFSPADVSATLFFGITMTNMAQDITGSKFIRVTFDQSVIRYNGGMYYLTRKQGEPRSVLLAANYSSLP